jgi:WD40 repeat protein
MHDSLSGLHVVSDFVAVGSPEGAVAASHYSDAGIGAVNAVCAVPMPDGTTLLATVGDDTLRLWNPTTCDQVGETLTGHTSTVNAVCAVPMPDGTTLLATAGDDKTVLRWELPELWGG